MSTPISTSRAALKRVPASTIGYLFAFVALGMSTAALGPTLPGLAKQTGSPLNEISFLFSARALGYLLGSIVSGRLYDRMPGHRVIVGVLILMATCLALVPAIPLLPLLALLLGILGMMEGSIDVGGNILIVWVHGDRVGPFMNALHFAFGVGAFIAPIVVAQAILLTDGIAWAYRLLALLMLPALYWLLRSPSPVPPASQEAGSHGPGRPWTVFLISALLFLYVAGEGSYGGWVYTYALNLGIGTQASAAYLTSAFWGALTIGRLVTIPLSMRFSPSTILAADLLGSLVGMAIVLLGRDSTVALWVGTLVVGFSMAAVFPVAISYASTRMDATGRVTAWFLVGASLGSMIWPWLIGQLFEPVGPQVTMWLITLAVVLSTGVFGFLMLDARRA
jgi:MFS transporter, FHS family, Na+ dependent glucose transporter 1